MLSSARMLALATRLGAYEIIAPLGAGGMGEAHRAGTPSGAVVVPRAVVVS